MIRADGSGSYRARVAVEREFGVTLDRLRRQAEREGFEILEETGDAAGRSIVIVRSFRQVSELDGDSGSYRLAIRRLGPLRSTYRLTVEQRRNLFAPGFDRTLRVRMPGRIVRTSAGQIEGDTVFWDSLGGGRLVVECEGFSLSPAGVYATAVVGLALVAGAVLLARRWKRRRRTR